jgi:hypothetical protein
MPGTLSTVRPLKPRNLAVDDRAPSSMDIAMVHIF